jgi:predicted phage terminase large subunit-like protein
VTLSRAQREISLQLARQELEWQERAEALELAEPDVEMAKVHLLEFVRFGQPRYQVGWFHRELCKALEWFSEEVAAGRSPRLLITAPPRHGKSEIVSRRFPVWHLGRNPEHEVVVSTYGQDLSNRMSRDARRVRDLAVRWWPHLAKRRGGADGVEHWEVGGGGSYKAVGAGGPLVGGGAHVIIIDDPFKNAQEADSETTRDSRWEWYTQTAYTRLAPGGGVIIVATRWHHDDLSGRALKQKELEEENWRVIDFPAIAEEDEPHRKAGEALHPERWPLPRLIKVKKAIGIRAWSALYQGRPTSAAGGLFQRKWLERRYDHDPQRPPQKYDQITFTVDGSFKDTETSSYVSIQVWGRWGWTDHHVLDEIHAQLDFLGTLQALKDLNAKWHPNVILVEDKANGPAIINVLRQVLPAVLEFDPTPFGNKIVRAQLVTPLWEGGNCALPKNGSFTSDFVEALANFPLAKLKDRVDAMSQYLIWCESHRHTADGWNASEGLGEAFQRRRAGGSRGRRR